MNADFARSRTADRLASKGFLAGTAVVLLIALTGCGGSSPAAAVAQKAASAPPAAAATTAAADSSVVAPSSAPSAATPASAPPTKAAAVASAAPVTTVKASGGGDFCKAVAASINKQTTAAGGTNEEIAARIATARGEELQAAQLAPASIKADVTTLFAATDAVWAALAKVNYDYSKLKPTDMSALSSPAVVAAEARLTAYMTGTCGITAPAPPTSTG
jgi:hypothetical protein